MFLSLGNYEENGGEKMDVTIKPDEELDETEAVSAGFAACSSTCSCSSSCTAVIEE